MGVSWVGWRRMTIVARMRLDGVGVDRMRMRPHTGFHSSFVHTESSTDIPGTGLDPFSVAPDMRVGQGLELVVRHPPQVHSPKLLSKPHCPGDCLRQHS